MKNDKILWKISQGMYVLTTDGGGCAGDNPLIAVSVMKKNYTNVLMKKNRKFAISVLGKDVNPEIIKTFGLKSMRDINKFENIKTTEIDGVKVIDNSLGYMVCDIIDSIDNDTHTLFIGRLTEADLYEDKEAMTYSYYQENKDDFLKVTTTSGKTAWICTVCGFVYYGEELPDDYKCPICGVDKSLFKKQ